ncbi:MAG: phosphate ABC transporter substrate-binding protein PstS, partial [Cutibacterium avidum]|nr:phosphate ABC transporter substrate-binding protein PstS [Cutibacterium avidum]
MTNRLAKITALAAIGAISLTACGANGDKGSSSASSSEATSAAASSANSANNADAASFKPACPGGNISGAGSSAQLNAINQVISDYKAACSSATINYSPTGSGAGVKSFIGKQTDWAGSDSVLNKDKGEPDKAKQRCNADPWHLPMAAGPIAVVYNVDGVKDLTLSTPTLAKIFSGAIKKWDDPAIKKENPSAKLPSAQIEVFYRKDESGTTDNFTKFLNKAAGDIWTEKHSKTWKGAGKGADKSAGIAQAVKETKNSISYDEWSYATKNKLDMAAIDNGNGPVKLTG